MSQVKILKKGSKTPDKETTDNAINNTVQKDNQQKEATNPSLGSFSMNGRTIQGQLALDRLFDKYKDVDLSERGMYDVANKAILEGQKVIYNPANNTIQVLDESGNDITGNYTKIKASPNDSIFKRTWDATFKNRADSFKRSGQYLSSIDMNTPEEQKEPVESKYKWERGNNDWWTNTKDGKSIDFEDVLNRDRWNTVINNIDNIYNSKDIKDIMNNEEYDMSAWSNNTTELERLRNLYNEIGDTPEVRQQYLNNLKQRLISGNLTTGDYDLLGLMGFKRPEESSTGTSSTSNNTESESIDNTNSDNSKNETIDSTPRIIQNEDGTYSIAGEEYKDTNWYLGGNPYFEDTDYKNGFYINNRLYTQEDIEKSPELQKLIAPFSELNKNNGYNAWYDAANNSGFRFYDDRIWAEKAGRDMSNPYYGAYTEYNYNSDYNPDMYKYLLNEGIENSGLINLSDMINWGDKSGYRLWSYIDPNKTNYAGVYIPQYVVIDSNNNYSKAYDNLDNILSDYNVNKKENWNPRFVDVNPWVNFNNTKIAHSFTLNGNESKYEFGKGLDGNYYLLRGENQNPMLIDKNKLSILMQYIKGTKPFSNQDILDLGTSGPIVVSDNLWKSHYKNGGKINWCRLNKLQFGGNISGDKNKGKISQNFYEGSRDISKAHKTNGEDGGLTNAEKMQIASTIGDVAGVVASFAPGLGNIIGSLIGAGSSTTRFASSISQDGFQIGDLKNYAIDLGLDAMSVIPGLGASGKLVKATRSIKAVAKPLSVLFGIHGLSAATSALQKIVSGDAKSSDWVDLLSGLSAATVGGASAASMKKQAKGTAEIINNNIKKAAEKTIELNLPNKQTITAKEIENLAKTTKGSQKELIARIKSYGSNEKPVTDEQANEILKKLGFDFTKSIKKGIPIINRKVVDKKGELKSNLGKGTTTFKEFKKQFNPFNSRQKEIANMIDRSDVYFANKNMSNGKASAKDYVISQLGVDFPDKIQGLNNTYTIPSKWTNVQLGGNYKLRNINPYFEPSNVKLIEAPKKPAPLRIEAGNTPDTKKPFRVDTFGNTYKDNQIVEVNWKPEQWWLDYQLARKTKPKYPYMVDMPLSTARTYGNGVSALEYLSFKQGGSIPKYIAGGSWGKGLEIDKNRVKDLFSNIAGNIASNKSWREEKASIDALKKRRFISPILVGERFSTAPIERKYEANIEPYRKIKFNNSDNRENLAGNLQVTDRITQFNNQKEAEISNLINNWNAKNVDRINKQRALDADMANQSSNYYAQLESQELARKSLKTQSDFGRWNEMYYQWRQEDKDRSNSLANLIYQHNYNNLKTNYENAVNTELQKKWKAAYDADTRANKGDLATWVRLNKAQEYSDWINSEDFKKRYNKLTEDINLAARKSLYTKSPLFKKGGKMNDERFALESNKDAKKAIRQAANHLNKLLQQLLK